MRSSYTEVLVCAAGKNLTKERYKIINELWNNGINAEILYNENPRMDKQLDYGLNNKIPFLIFIGENELKENKVKIKCLANSQELTVDRDKMVEEIMKLKLDKNLLIIKKK